MEQRAPSFDQVISGRSEHQAGVLKLIAEATQSIAWLDFDFSEVGMGSQALYEQLQRLLRQQRSNSLRLLMADTRYLATRCARFTRLNDLFSSQIECRLLRQGQWDGRSSLAVDTRHILVRQQPHSFFGRMALDAPSLAEPMVSKFDFLWDDAEPCLPRTTLGL